jgi:serine/threonine protein kinase
VAWGGELGRSGSLGQLAVHQGLIPEVDCKRLCLYVAHQAKAGKPISLGHLLLKGGISASQLCELLGTGADLECVACDACSTQIAQARITSRDEYPCPNCGALFFGFRPFSSAPGNGPVAQVQAPSGDALDRTVEFGGVIPLPGVTLASQVSVEAAQTTAAFSEVLRAPGHSDPEGIYVLPSGGGRRSSEDAYSELFRLQAGLPAVLPHSATQSISAIPSGGSAINAAGLSDLGPAHESVAGYRLLSPLGRGGMGQVFLAESPDGDQVALKLLLPSKGDATTLIERFKWEAEALERCSHPNLVEVFDSGYDSQTDTHYLALEYVEGGTLAHVLAKTKVIDEGRALKIARGLCLALQVAAEMGIVHRDVKPANILLNRAGEPKLADLGLSKDTKGSLRLTATGLVMGTPAYMAPEQALSETCLDVRADLYALGGCVYEMLTGKVPFVEPGRNLIDVVRKRLTEDLPNVRFTHPDVSRATAEIVGRLTRRNRDDRYSSPEEAIADIDIALEGLASNSPRALPSSNVETQPLPSLEAVSPKWLVVALVLGGLTILLLIFILIAK